MCPQCEAADSFEVHEGCAPTISQLPASIHGAQPGANPVLSTHKVAVFIF